MQGVRGDEGRCKAPQGKCGSEGRCKACEGRCKGPDGQRQGVEMVDIKGLPTVVCKGSSEISCMPELAMASASTDGFKLLFFLVLLPVALRPSPGYPKRGAGGLVSTPPAPELPPSSHRSGTTVSSESALISDAVQAGDCLASSDHLSMSFLRRLAGVMSASGPPKRLRFGSPLWRTKYL